MKSNPTIVLADDEQLIRRAYVEILQRAGYKVFAAGDGDEALELIKQNQPDLVLLDLIMPKKTGLEVLKILKADKNLAKLPVVILSNLSQIADENEAKALGVLDFVIKSDHSIKEILSKVQGYLS